ncbi:MULTISPECIES: hypothetical protein [unclassified Bradyrhizobium]|uniref:hypothetical protein n=1 Tax=unclassified Bradyrhizobium TaxID=2631580 RepID=UPI001BA7EFA4|nr:MULTISPECIES: hypothetical protein [unclassified Bradyrhizobium]MBR1227957.1 hypothetical protein [Bradyrhizobium sp. AUGA SZCCT0176]MBR1295965.1 hypothetical protein [Bradyrhizobium sp. AUGA SZCCT0042]
MAAFAGDTLRHRSVRTGDQTPRIGLDRENDIATRDKRAKAFRFLVGMKDRRMATKWSPSTNVGLVGCGSTTELRQHCAAHDRSSVRLINADVIAEADFYFG